MTRRPHPFPTVLVVLLALASLPARGDDRPYPAGTSEQHIEGLKTLLVLPRAFPAGKPASLVVILHGAGGTATGMAGSFARWAQDDYVVCAPKSKGQVWEKDDLDRVLRIATHLEEVLPIDPDKVHVVGFSNGGWNLAPLAFDDDLHPCSATWMAAGCQGGNVPKWARKGLGAIALAGTEDPNAHAAGETVRILKDKVRNVEVRYQEGIGHKLPVKLLPYLQWWMGVQEGRFTPGDDLGFDWTDDLDAAVTSLEGAKKGGVMVYFYAAEDQDKPEARVLQQGVFFDLEIRFLGRQLRCVALDAAEHDAEMAKLKVQTTPSLVILNRHGKVKKVFSGKFKVRKIARTLRGVAPHRHLPKS